MCDRIASFAEEITPIISELAGQMIKQANSQGWKDHEFAVETIWDCFQIKYREPTCRLALEVFQPLDDWGKESALASTTLLLSAFKEAISQSDIWDRRSTCKTITTKISNTMFMHINSFRKDRGI